MYWSYCPINVLKEKCMSVALITSLSITQWSKKSNSDDNYAVVREEETFVVNEKSSISEDEGFLD
jgi:hypothetical protein